MENQLNTRRVRSLHSLVQVGAITGVTEAMEQDVAKADTRKHRTVKLWMLCAEVVERRNTLRKSVLKAKCSTHSLEVQQASTSSAGAGEPLYFDDDGQPIFTHMVSVLQCKTNI